MAIRYDFPTNYEEKIKEVDKLLEKKYIDQAICLLEDWLVSVGKYSVDCEKEIQKKLLGCYLALKEFDSCKGIISHLRELGGIDLTTAAYDIAISLIQYDEDGVNLKKSQYQNELNLSLFACKNLIELAFQIKTIYEDDWLSDVDKTFKELLQAIKFEEKLTILANLQDIESEYFQYYKDSIKIFIEKESLSMIRTLVFELCAEKAVELEVVFNDGDQVKKMITSMDYLKPFYEAIEQGKNYIFKMELEEVNRLFLEQQLVMFFQFIFPFYEEIDTSVLIQEFIQYYKMNNIKFEPSLFEEKAEKRELTLAKINEYLLSLSLLI